MPLITGQTQSLAKTPCLHLQHTPQSIGQHLKLWPVEQEIEREANMF
jgi:hypothetical protein